MEPQKHDGLKKSAFGGMVWKLSERVCARLVSLAVSIVLARILVPEDYSLVSIVAIFFVFCNVFISGGLNTALIQKKDADALDYSTVLWATLVVALVMYTGMFACAPLIAGLYDKPQLVPVIRVMGLTFFINAFKSVLSAYTSSHLQFRKFFFSTIIGTVISAFIGIIMALRGFGAWALVAQEMSNSLIDTLVLLFTTELRVRLRFSKGRLRGLFSYGSKNFLSAILHTIYEQVSPLIIGLRFSPADLAFYTKGRTFPEIINTTLSDTLAAVLFPVLSRVQDNLEDVLGITRRYVKSVSFILFPVMLGMLAVSDSFVILLLTEKWLPAAIYIRIFCVTYIFNLMDVGAVQAIRAIGRSDIILIQEIVKKAAYFVVLTGFVFLSDSPEVMAFSALVCTLIGVVVASVPSRKLIGYRYSWQICDILPNLILSGCMCFIVRLIGRLPISAGVLLPIQIVSGIAVYVSLSIITKNESFQYLLNYGKQILG